MSKRFQRQPRRPLRNFLTGAAIFILIGSGMVVGALHLRGREPGRNLAVKLEGAFNDRNFRDVGASLNECLGERRMVEGKVFRAAMWFSGWPCAGVGAPEAVYSLNYDPADREEYFCYEPDGRKMIGRHFTTQGELNNVEFETFWQDAERVADLCRYFHESFADIAGGKRILVHCDAGRDRTGTYSAILQALTLEHTGRLDDRILRAIECDYQKSRSLSPRKHGRMRDFITLMMESENSVANFISERCGVSEELLVRTAQVLGADAAP